jgi:phospho-N-acetylmuramoyl-pentapeptide-transferase
MLLDLFEWLTGYYGGFRVFGYFTLRAIFAALTALTIALFVGPSMIRMLAARQIGQVVRDDGPGSHHVKRGTPTMGGALILIAVTAGRPVGRASNRFVWIALTVTLSFGLIGFYDDYLKLVVRPRGLARAGSTSGSRWPASPRRSRCGRPRPCRRRPRSTCRSSRAS